MVDAVAEREVSGGVRAGDVEAVGVSEDGRVAVGGEQRDLDELAGGIVVPAMVTGSSRAA